MDNRRAGGCELTIKKVWKLAGTASGSSGSLFACFICCHEADACFHTINTIQNCAYHPHTSSIVGWMYLTRSLKRTYYRYSQPSTILTMPYPTTKGLSNPLLPATLSYPVVSTTLEIRTYLALNARATSRTLTVFQAPWRH